MTVYVVAQSRIDDPAKLDQYVQAAVPTLVAGGAKILSVDVDAEIVEGEPPGARTVLLEFESKDAFRAWYDSPEYQSIVGLRLSAAPGFLVVAEGFVPPSG